MAVAEVEAVKVGTLERDAVVVLVLDTVGLPVRVAVIVSVPWVCVDVAVEDAVAVAVAEPETDDVRVLVAVPLALPLMVGSFVVVAVNVGPFVGVGSLEKVAEADDDRVTEGDPVLVRVAVIVRVTVDEAELEAV